ncbi:MAG TPA: nicotinate-nucleotide adenylyltransferase [Chthoniobacterales bacterium]|nr:nicotinate-nucleotide adenylyltransferase [Chthoniobacterales bacterium]
MKIAIFGGTFDPIHHGHLILARQALEELNLDLVIFVPAAESPFKTNHQSAPAQHRLQMVRLATANEPGFALDSMEIDRGGTSFSIDTVLAIRKKYPGAELFFLVGEDNVDHLVEWHRFEELDKLVRFIVLSRTDKRLPKRYPIIHRHFEISATEIRNRVANRQQITYLVPEVVLRYILDHNLYQGERLSARRS